MSKVPDEMYLSFTLNVAVHQEDSWAIEFLRGLADSGLLTWVEGNDDSRFELLITDVLTTREQDAAIHDVEEDYDDRDDEDADTPDPGALDKRVAAEVAK